MYRYCSQDAETDLYNDYLKLSNFRPPTTENKNPSGTLITLSVSQSFVHYDL